uniref:NTF2 domain-containing protein n=1 Tax=Sciurus vulgaris TaxID=55149 RepID=A0A8D2BE90_SCIVU
MVMEKPSPLLVGREFVRQYYTLLNQAPDMLHRFYGKNSSYPADAVYGQKEIHRKVMSQNFTNCHTKIRHVDAHATLNDGVVVQVMGLLSNNNQALRRFMQTFVLAPEEKMKRLNFLAYFAYTDWNFFFFKPAISPKECILLITDIWYVSFIGIFLTYFLRVSKPVRKAGFDKHFGGRKYPNCLFFKS